MKKILFYIVLPLSAVLLQSCATVSKTRDLNKSSFPCGNDVTLWESLPPSEHNTYDVTLSVKKNTCYKKLLVQDIGGTWTTNVIEKVKDRVFPRATKIILQCVSSDSPIADQCSYTIHDVRKSPTDASATVTITNYPSVNITCGTTNLAFTATNSDGADITLLWKNGSPCTITLIAERARVTGTVTNLFIHENNQDNQLSTIHAVKKLYVTCSGNSPSTTDCSCQIVETEYP